MAFPAPAYRLKDLTAGWRYRNGGDHFAHDYGMPIGTPLYATANGKVLDCNWGVPNNPVGVRKRPSNWILLRVKYKGKYATIYYQHLSPNVKVRPGDYVKAGQLIGYSGNSGWSTGPHLHIAAGWGQWTEATRYSYMKNDGRNDIVLFAPTKLWLYKWVAGTQWYGYRAGVNKTTNLWTRLRTRDGSASEADRWWVKMIQAQLGVKVDGYFGPATRDAVIKWKKARGYTTKLQFVGKVTAQDMGLPV